MLPSEYSEDLTILNSKFTERAHDKDVNAVSVSPNDKLIATGIVKKLAIIITETWRLSKQPSSVRTCLH